MRTIGIDIGTTSISAAVVRVEDRTIEKAYTIENGSFQDTRYIWEKQQNPEIIISKAKGLLDEIMEEYDDIQSIGLTGQMHGIVYVNAEGRHISPLYTWQDGSGSQPCSGESSVCDILEEKYNVKTYSGFGLVTYLYQNKMNTVPRDAAHFCNIMDYLGMILTERKVPLMHQSNAAGLGIYDVQNNCFITQVIENMGGDVSLLPEVTEELQIQGYYHNIPVYVALGDNQASFLGSVKDMSDAILVNMGTGGQISVWTDSYYKVDGVETRPFLKDSYLLVGASLCGGRAYAMLKGFFQMYGDALGVKDINHYEIMAKFLEEDYDADTASLMVNTCFCGTREAPEKRGSIENIGIDNFTPAAFTRGVLEGMAGELSDMYQQIEKKTGIKRSKMTASGNGLRLNQYLQKCMCSKFHMSLELAEHKEEAAYGAAITGIL